jgi:hypothetical protein
MSVLRGTIMRRANRPCRRRDSRKLFQSGAAGATLTRSIAHSYSEGASRVGSLTATIHGARPDLEENRRLLAILTRKTGRLVFNGFPAGVEVCASMQHGGPWPATTDPRFTSVGSAAIQRFSRPLCFQDCPNEFLASELQALPCQA